MVGKLNFQNTIIFRIIDKYAVFRNICTFSNNMLTNTTYFTIVILHKINGKSGVPHLHIYTHFAKYTNHHFRINSNSLIGVINLLGRKRKL